MSSGRQLGIGRREVGGADIKFPEEEECLIPSTFLNLPVLSLDCCLTMRRTELFGFWL